MRNSTMRRAVGIHRLWLHEINWVTASNAFKLDINALNA